MDMRGLTRSFPWLGLLLLERFLSPASPNEIVVRLFCIKGGDALALVCIIARPDARIQLFASCFAAFSAHEKMSAWLCRFLRHRMIRSIHTGSGGRCGGCMPRLRSRLRGWCEMRNFPHITAAGRMWPQGVRGVKKRWPGLGEFGFMPELLGAAFQTASGFVIKHGIPCCELPRMPCSAASSVKP